MVYLVVIQYKSGEPLIFKAYHEQTEAESLATAIRNDLHGFGVGYIEKVYVRGVEYHQG